MRSYAKIGPKFWIGATGKQLRAQGVQAQLVALYLMTSPHANMLGLYYVSIGTIGHETGLGFEGASEGLRRAIEAGFCSYDEASEMVWVHEMAAYQIAEKLSPKDNQVKSVQKEYDELLANPFLEPFFEKYGAAFCMSNCRKFESPFEPPLNPLRSQEQEQEQEQEKEIVLSKVGDAVGTAKGGAAASPATEPFAMHLDWQPSPHVAELARQSGMVVTTDAIASARAEFVSYWLARPSERRTQHEWDHALLRAIRGAKLSQGSGANREATRNETRAERRDRERAETVAALTGLSRRPVGPDIIDIDTNETE